MIDSIKIKRTVPIQTVCVHVNIHFNINRFKKYHSTERHIPYWYCNGCFIVVTLLVMFFSRPNTMRKSNAFILPATAVVPRRTSLLFRPLLWAHMTSHYYCRVPTRHNAKCVLCFFYGGLWCTFSAGRRYCIIIRYRLMICNEVESTGGDRIYKFYNDLMKLNDRKALQRHWILIILFLLGFTVFCDRQQCRFGTTYYFVELSIFIVLLLW